jgi:hypothetical protein
MRWRDILKNMSFILRTKYCVGVVLLMLSLVHCGRKRPI